MLYIAFYYYFFFNLRLFQFAEKKLHGKGIKQNLEFMYLHGLQNRLTFFLNIEFCLIFLHGVILC
jgi:hypothetical protein